MDPWSIALVAAITCAVTLAVTGLWKWGSELLRRYFARPDWEISRQALGGGWQLKRTARRVAFEVDASLVSEDGETLFSSRDDRMQYDFANGESVGLPARAGAVLVIVRWIDRERRQAEHTISGDENGVAMRAIKPPRARR